jgi:hypothetical protein
LLLPVDWTKEGFWRAEYNASTGMWKMWYNHHEPLTNLTMSHSSLFGTASPDNIGIHLNYSSRRCILADANNLLGGVKVVDVYAKNFNARPLKDMPWNTIPIITRPTLSIGAGPNPVTEQVAPSPAALGDAIPELASGAASTALEDAIPEMASGAASTAPENEEEHEDDGHAAAGAKKKKRKKRVVSTPPPMSV